ncbi:glycoprotein X [Purpureocillium lavendulum]|uniref:Glycoprotein X n=1 Tax=Purpureocillium lavendulum TaxID=1247861 RepID=A0AB34G6U2_9HYPO|nr:glycoprotein X [Purpureocillium lavendulum]
MGYVFWDFDRLRQPAVWARLNEAKSMSEERTKAIYDPSLDTSAEEKLQGVWLSAQLMKDIEKEYGDQYLI